MLGFDPFPDIDQLTERMLGTRAGSERVPRFIPMDLYRSGDHYVLHADLPGVDPGSIEVSVENGVLTLTAMRSERTEHDVEWMTSERFAGRFVRRLHLGEGIDADNISATYQNGVLTVTLPAQEQAKRRRITVASRGQQKAVDANAPDDPEQSTE
ncbi:Hsp20/alpha crystallin family protein [Rhodococcus sp. NPDC003348]